PWPRKQALDGGDQVEVALDENLAPEERDIRVLLAPGDPIEHRLLAVNHAVPFPILPAGDVDVAVPDLDDPPVDLRVVPEIETDGPALVPQRRYVLTPLDRLEQLCGWIRRHLTLDRCRVWPRSLR